MKFIVIWFVRPPVETSFPCLGHFSRTLIRTVGLFRNRGLSWRAEFSEHLRLKPIKCSPLYGRKPAKTSARGRRKPKKTLLEADKSPRKLCWRLTKTRENSAEGRREPAKTLLEASAIVTPFALRYRLPQNIILSTVSRVLIEVLKFFFRKILIDCFF